MIKVYYLIWNKPRVEPKQIIFSDENQLDSGWIIQTKPVAVVPPRVRAGFMKNKEASKESSGKCEIHINLLLILVLIIYAFLLH